VLLGAAGVLVPALVAVVVAAAWLGSGHGSPVATAPLSVGVSRPPPPLRGAIVLAGESGSRAVALDVTDGRLRATVLGDSGSPLSGLSLSFRVGDRVVRAHPCGEGCYEAAASARGRVEVRPGGSPPVVLRIPASAPSAAPIVRRASRVLRGLRSLVYVESLRSGPSGGLVTTWKMAAPDRLSYRIKNGAAAVVIGTTRWDQERPGGAWTRSPQSPALRVPQPAWGDRAENAHVLGQARVDGRPVWVVSFVNPTIPAWFMVSIDRESYRTLRLRMTAAAHFMSHRYVEFDRPLKIVRPN
jgi:hypothetical protein